LAEPKSSSFKNTGKDRPKRPPSSFKALAGAMLCDGSLSPAEREFLSEWVNDPLAEGTWRTIQTKAHKHRRLRIVGSDKGNARTFWDHFDRWIIGQILLVKPLADRANLEWARRGHYSRHAATAEELVKLLREPLAAGLPAPIPVSNDFVQQLEEVARKLHLAELNMPGGMKISPLDRNSSRVRVAFMSLMSEGLLALCGRWLDEVVARLTDRAYFRQDQVTTVAMVRSARTSQKGRTVRDVPTA
jgi:hypothetical protein